VPRVRRSPALCVGNHSECPRVRVYLAALGRNAFPPGRYRLRWFDVGAFFVRAPAPATTPGLPPLAPLTPPPPLEP